MLDEPNSEILAASELAVKGAKQELNRTLDYSIDSFKDLEALIQLVKNRFTKMEKEGKLTEQIIQSASISIGAYLGEVIRRKIGGTWIAKNPPTEVLVINGHEFSPILYAFERLTKDVNYSLEWYYSDVNRKHWETPNNTSNSQSQTNTVACRSCGQGVARTAPVCPSCGDTYPGLIAKCPTCGSKNIRILPKGFSLGKSVAGALIAGPLGVLGGLHGKNDLQVPCSSCHRTFTIKSHEI